MQAAQREMEENSQTQRRLIESRAPLLFGTTFHLRHVKTGRFLAVEMVEKSSSSSLGQSGSRAVLSEGGDGCGLVVSCALGIKGRADAVYSGHFLQLFLEGNRKILDVHSPLLSPDRVGKGNREGEKSDSAVEEWVMNEATVVSRGDSVAVPFSQTAATEKEAAIGRRRRQGPAQPTTIRRTTYKQAAQEESSVTFSTRGLGETMLSLSLAFSSEEIGKTHYRKVDREYSELKRYSQSNSSRDTKAKEAAEAADDDEQEGNTDSTIVDGRANDHRKRKNLSYLNLPFFFFLFILLCLLYSFSWSAYCDIFLLFLHCYFLLMTLSDFGERVPILKSSMLRLLFSEDSSVLIAGSSRETSIDEDWANAIKVESVLPSSVIEDSLFSLSSLFEIEPVSFASQSPISDENRSEQVQTATGGDFEEGSEGTKRASGEIDKRVGLLKWHDKVRLRNVLTGRYIRLVSENAARAEQTGRGGGVEMEQRKERRVPEPINIARLYTDLKTVLGREATEIVVDEVLEEEAKPEERTGRSNFVASQCFESEAWDDVFEVVPPYPQFRGVVFSDDVLLFKSTKFKKGFIVKAGRPTVTADTHTAFDLTMKSDNSFFGGWWRLEPVPLQV